MERDESANPTPDVGCELITIHERGITFHFVKRWISLGVATLRKLTEAATAVADDCAKSAQKRR